MNAFIALFVATLAVAVQAGHVRTSWPLTTYGVDSWNGLSSWNTLNSWNHLAAYPYGVNQWSSPAATWPAYNGWYGKATPLVQTTVSKVNPWGLPLASYGYGYNIYPKYVATNTESVHVTPLVGHAVNQKFIVA